MSRFRKIPVIAAFVAAIASFGLTMSANAVPILGSLNLVSFGVADNGQNLLVRTTFAPAGLQVGFTSGSFGVVPLGTSISGGALNLASLNTFNFTITGVGTFTDGGFGNVITVHTATNLDVYLLGTFTPLAGGLMNGFDTGPSSVRLALTRAGSTISYSGSEASPPEEILIPEPVSMALLGTALLGLGVMRRRV